MTIDTHPVAGHQPAKHVVQFYEDDTYLIDVVAPFLSRGLSDGEHALVLATGVHQAQLAARMIALGADVEGARRAGRFQMVDAHDALAQIMVDGHPCWARFRATIGALVDRSGPPVRAFGELVNILVLSGRANAAVELEQLWNRFGETHPVWLMCGYHIDGFSKDAEDHKFTAVCHAHDDVRPTESIGAAIDDPAQRRHLVALQRRARALEAEVARRSEMERELRRSQADLADFIENAVESLHCVGPDGTILWANPAELALLGYPSEEYVGRKIVDFHADRDVIEDVLARLLRNETIVNQEARLIRRDGTIRDVAIHSNALWRDGALVHTRCFTRDITDRKRAEADLRAAEEERGRLLVQEQAARREAEAANRAKDEFLAMLGHELRNPLTPILTAVELLRMRGDTSREIDVIERQAGHIARLVDDLLDVSRISRGNLEVRIARVELWDVVRDAVETASTLLEQRRHVLSIEVPRHGCAVNGDRVRLAQVVANLLTNAAKYSDPGSRIAVAVSAETGSVALRVRDHGIGIAPELVDQIFDAFVQQPQAIDRAHGGLGLGLAIVRSLVRLHGGTVTVESAGAGRGSEFVVILPAAPTIDTATTQEMATIVPAVGAKVMIVDDNEDAALMLATALHQHGFDVQVAHDGPEALALAATFAPEVALVDIGLPVMDGYELAQRLRRDRATAGIELIAITGYGQDADRVRARDAGFAEHMMKPVDLTAVRRLISRATSR